MIAVASMENYILLDINSLLLATQPCNLSQWSYIDNEEEQGEDRFWETLQVKAFLGEEAAANHHFLASIREELEPLQCWNVHASGLAVPLYYTVLKAEEWPNKMGFYLWPLSIDMRGCLLVVIRLSLCYASLWSLIMKHWACHQSSHYWNLVVTMFCMILCRHGRFERFSTSDISS